MEFENAFCRDCWKGMASEYISGLQMWRFGEIQYKLRHLTLPSSVSTCLAYHEVETDVLVHVRMDPLASLCFLVKECVCEPTIEADRARNGLFLYPTFFFFFLSCLHAVGQRGEGTAGVHGAEFIRQQL